MIDGAKLRFMRNILTDEVRMDIIYENGMHITV